MKWRDFFAKWDLTGLKLKLSFLEATFDPRNEDRAAAWEIYVELLTRVTIQSLPSGAGDEKAALDSVHAIFPLTREILRRHGAECVELAKLAVPILNQIIRPFTAKWHRLSLAGAFADPARCSEFRGDLESLQRRLRQYMGALSDMAQVEDLTRLEEPEA